MFRWLVGLFDPRKRQIKKMCEAWNEAMRQTRVVEEQRGEGVPLHVTGMAYGRLIEQAGISADAASSEIALDELLEVAEIPEGQEASYSVTKAAHLWASKEDRWTAMEQAIQWVEKANSTRDVNAAKSAMRAFGLFYLYDGEGLREYMKNLDKLHPGRA